MGPVLYVTYLHNGTGQELFFPALSAIQLCLLLVSFFDAVKEAGLAHTGFPKVLIFLLWEQANPAPKIQPSDHTKMKHTAPWFVFPRIVSAKHSWETGRGMGTTLQQDLAINTC